MSARETAWCGGGGGRGRDSLWLSASVGDCGICPLEPGDTEPAVRHPLLFCHRFGPAAGTRLGAPTDSQEGREALWDPSSGGHLSLPR